MADRQSENIDDLVHVRAHEVGAQHPFRPFLDQDLEAEGGFGRCACCEPVGGLLIFDSVEQTLILSLPLRQPDRRDRRDCEGHARDAAIVRPFGVTVQNVGRHDLGVVAGHGGQRRTDLGCVARGIDGWIGNALQKFVELQAASFMLDPGGVKAEIVDRRSSSGGVNDQISMDIDGLPRRSACCSPGTLRRRSALVSALRARTLKGP